MYDKDEIMTHEELLERFNETFVKLLKQAKAHDAYIRQPLDQEVLDEFSDDETYFLTRNARLMLAQAMQHLAAQFQIKLGPNRQEANTNLSLGMRCIVKVNA